MGCTPSKHAESRCSIGELDQEILKEFPWVGINIRAVEEFIEACGGNEKNDYVINVSSTQNCHDHACDYDTLLSGKN